MLSGTSSTDDSDGVEKMARHEVETEAEKWCMAQKYSGACQPRSYSDLRQTCCANYDKLPAAMYPPRMLDAGRRRRKKTKNQAQHCPSCHCPFDSSRPWPGKTKYGKNVEAVLSAYEVWLENPESQALKSSQNNIQPARYQACNHDATTAHQHRKRQTSSHRRQCRNEEDQTMYNMMSSALNFDENDNCDYCYGYLQSAKNRCKSEAPWREEQMTSGAARNPGVDRDTTDRFVQHRRTLRQESPLLGQRVDRRQNSCEKCELYGNEDDEFGHGKGTLRFHPSKHEDSKKMEDRGSRRTQGNETTNLSALKSSLLQTTRNKNGEELEEADSRTVYKPSIRTVTRQDSPCKPDAETVANREKARMESYCELIGKNEEEETQLQRKNVYAGGDLDLQGHKSDMMSLIERVIGSKCGASLDQQKNGEPNEGALDQGICTEIMRELQADYTQRLAEGAVNRQEKRPDCINQMKMLRSQQMQHIQNEFTKLCSLQEILDNFSPRQSQTASFEPHSDVVEVRSEDRQQRQYEEKQKLGMIS